MTDRERLQAKKERYLSDKITTRLGNLASSLARLATYVSRRSPREAVLHLLREAEYFIDWTGPQVAPEIQSDLAEMQVELARWRLRCDRSPSNEIDREAVASFARDSSQRVLQWSGLLEIGA